VIEAAGGLVWRITGDREVELLLVHRPRYDDWSLPKGKIDPGEDAADAARREVEEETGLRCRLGPEVAETRYVDRHGRQKRVRYWAMQPVHGTFVPNGEVDRIRWCSTASAAAILTYDHDLRLVAALDHAALAP
jgi:8-oxo-dGTP pyrophosphatase MutT (NUDIX family)